MKQYKLAVFDLDGTLLDTLEDLMNAVNDGLRKKNYPERNLEEIRSFVGNGMQNLIRKSVPQGTAEADMQEVLAYFREFYKIHCKDCTRPYKGVSKALEVLKEKGIHLAMLSNKPDFAVGQLADQYFPGLFEMAAGEREGIPRKPAPDALWSVMEEFGCSKDDIVYIGDSEVDVKTAQNAGIPLIAVSWGFRSLQTLKDAGAKTIISDPEELVAKISE